MHLTTSSIDWYAARAAGIAAYVLLTAVLALGLSLASRAPGRRWQRWPMFAVEDVHRYGGLLVGSFIAIHVVTIAIDAFMPFSLTQLLIPLTAGYRPIWTGLGIAAAELLLALAVTNHYRKRLPFRWWRAAHYANFAVWIAATLHGIGTGTDRNAPWMLAIYVVSTALVCSLLIWRIASRRELPGLVTGGRVAGASVAAGVVVLALALGPLKIHSRPWNATTFHDQLSGKILQQTGASLALVSMTGTGHGSQNVEVRADLLVGANSLRATTFQLEFLPSGMICTGRVTSVHAFGFSGTCKGRDAVRRFVDASWRLTNGGRLSGQLAEHT